MQNRDDTQFRALITYYLVQVGWYNVADSARRAN